MDEIKATEEVKPEKSKKRKIVEVVLSVVLVVASLNALIVAGVLIYQKRYLSPFWVNGQSMYPTLNKNATNAEGVPYNENGSSVENGSTWVDYGVMDKHERALKKLKRFDIVVCTYGDHDASDKIKRVVGLPGETIKFGQGEDNGKLYLKNGDGEFYVVDQPIDNQYVASGSYPISEITLGNDQYYVLGDNRAHSSDSRNVGPISYTNLIGKVVAICAHCEIRLNENNQLEPTKIIHYPPRFL